MSKKVPRPDIRLAKPLRPKRSDLGPTESLCDYCTAKCCRYFALPIDTPTTRQDFDFMKWFLLHGSASIFVDSDVWYLIVHTTCKHLQPDQRCGIYETRPQICRDYSTKDCEYDEDWTYEHYFETAEQIEEFADAVLPKKRGESIRSPRPPLLPILSVHI